MVVDSLVKVFEGSDKEFYMDGYMKSNLDIAKRVIVKDWDMFSIYDGYEGVGKSVKVMQDAFYCDPTLNLDRVVYNPDEFERACLSSNKYEAIIWDEAFEGLNISDHYKEITKGLRKMIAKIRQRNLFVFIVVPSFFDLIKSVALWRARWLVHCYTVGEFERGYFSYYNMDRKLELYVKGKEYYNYDCVKPNFYGRFTNKYVLSEEDYRKKKDAHSFKKEEDKEVCKEDFYRELFDRLQGIDLSHERRQEVLNMPRSTYFYKLNQRQSLNSRVPIIVK